MHEWSELSYPTGHGRIFHQLRDIYRGGLID